MESESPSDQLASLTLYQADEELPEYVSSVGSSVSQQKKNTIEVSAEMADHAMAMIQDLAQQVSESQQQIAALQQQIAAGSTGTPMDLVPMVPVVPIAVKNASFNAWDAKVTESGKFKIGTKDSAFSSKKSRNNYIRLLMNGFLALPEFQNVSFNQLFDPLNGYANFQTLLNRVQVPNDHVGFYLNDNKKLHLISPFLSSPEK